MKEMRREERNTVLFGVFFPFRNEILYIYSILYVLKGIHESTHTHARVIEIRHKNKRSERDKPLIHHENVTVILFVSCLISFLLTSAFVLFSSSCFLTKNAH